MDNVLGTSEEPYTVLENIVHLHLSIEFIPQKKDEHLLKVFNLQNNLHAVLRYNYPSLETIHVKILPDSLGDQFYFSFKTLCLLLERHSQRLSTVYIQAPKLKPINVSSDLELPGIYTLLSYSHPKLTFHVTIGDSAQETFAAQDYDQLKDFLSDLTDAVLNNPDTVSPRAPKKLVNLDRLFDTFTGSPNILS